MRLESLSSINCGEKKTPLLSVIMPCRNSSAFLSEAIESILNQSFSDFELIIIDNGSTDLTPEIIKSFSSRDCRVIALTEERTGVSYALNSGIRVARADLLVRMDSDDVMLPNRLQVQYEFMKTHAKIGVLGGMVLPRLEDGRFERTNSSVMAKPRGDRDLKLHLCFRNPFFHPTVIMRKEVALQGGGYRHVKSEDYDLWVRLAIQGVCFENLNIPLIYYRLHANQVTRDLDSIYLDSDYLRIQKIYRAHIRNKLISIDQGDTLGMLVRLVKYANLKTFFFILSLFLNFSFSKPLFSKKKK